MPCSCMYIMYFDAIYPPPLVLVSLTPADLSNQSSQGLEYLSMEIGKTQGRFGGGGEGTVKEL